MTVNARTALITGASAGIGATFARFLAAEGYNLILVARREERLRELSEALSVAHGVRCEFLAADLTHPDAPRKIMEHATALGMNIDFLVNNAGLSGRGKFVDTPWSQLAGEIQLMITALTELSHRVAPGMKERGWGRIINLSSLAAFSPPGASLLYTAIKSYVLLLSESLDMELKPHGVHVTALCPGFTWSEFHDVMGTREEAGKLPGFLWQEPEDVVREAYAAAMKGKPVCVPGMVNKMIAGAMRPVPESVRYQLGNRFNPFK